MTLLSICQDTADMIGLTRPSAIVTGSDDQLARQFLAAAKKTLEEMSIMEWPILQTSYSYNTVANQAQYALPSDFGREIGDSVYSTARYEQVRGSLSPGDWARQRNTFPAAGRFKFRIFGNPLKLFMTPTPTTVENFTLEYQTLNRVTASGGAMKATYTDDQDVSVVPEDIMKKGVEWRIRRVKGLDYSEEFDDYELTRTQRLAQAMQFGSTPIAYRAPYDAPELGMPYVPDTGFGQ